MKRVITKRAEDGTSIIEAVGEPKTVVRFGPGFEIHEIWRLDEFPDSVRAGYDPECYGFEPAHGAVFRIVVLPPDDDVVASLQRGDQWGANTPYKGESEESWLHSTDTVDLVSVISGRVDLYTVEGASEHLEAGDLVVQQGTEHAWRNPGPAPVVLSVIMFGTH